MTQPAYDVLSEKRRLESAGIPAEQAEAILESVTRATTVNEEWGRKLDHVQGSVTQLEVDVAYLKADVAELKVDVAYLKADVAELKVDVAGLKTDMAEMKINVAELKFTVASLNDRMNETATTKDVDTAFAVFRADIYRALWVQGLSLGTLILGLAVLVATVAVF